MDFDGENKVYAPQKEADAFENVSGEVADVVYQNKESGWGVIVVDDAGSPVTAVGYLAGVWEGEYVELYGSYTTHSTYGLQLKVEYYEGYLPENEHGILRFLSSGALSGIGPVTAKLIMKEFGEDALNIILDTPEALTRVRGINAAKAKQASKTLHEMLEIKDLTEAYLNRGIEPLYAFKAQRQYGSADAVRILEENPYLLCADHIGLDFAKADAAALFAGIDRQSVLRAAEGIRYVLRHNLENGHTFLPRGKALGAACGLLGIEAEQAEAGLEKLCADGDACTDTIRGIPAIALSELYYAERRIAVRLAELAHQNIEESDFQGLIPIIEGAAGISYNEEQRQAILYAATCNALVITGGPGTGKTTTLRGILELFDMMDKRVALCAPTGRAAERLTKLTGREGQTIHRLLEMEPFEDRMKFTKNAEDPLNADVLVVDELSMVDVLLFDALLAAMKFGAKIIMVGDADQLPSVGAGNLLKDIIRSATVPVVALEHIFRQAAQSLIVVNAHSIVHGEVPEIRVKDNDFFFLERQSVEETAQAVVDLVRRRLPKSYGFNPVEDIQVICPSKKGIAGVESLNEMLRDALNPYSEKKEEVTVMGRRFRVGDKVMQVKNNYDIVWKRDEKEFGQGIFNGELGRIAAIDHKNETVSISFDGKLVSAQKELMADITHAYAMTVHKSQGNEFEAVILPLFHISPRLFYRSLLYTAVTRAKKLLIIVGREDAVGYMVENNKSANRYSALGQMLEEEYG